MDSQNIPGRVRELKADINRICALNARYLPKNFGADSTTRRRAFKKRLCTSHMSVTRCSALIPLRAELERSVYGSDQLIFSRRVSANGLEAFRVAKQRGYEGVVAKRVA